MEAGVTKADLDTTVGIHPKAAAELVTMRTPTRKIQVNLPAAVLSQPPIGQIGLTEEQAIKEYGDVDIFASNFRPCKATLSGLSDRVFMKLIVYAKTNKVVGIHMNTFKLEICKWKIYCSNKNQKYTVVSFGEYTSADSLDDLSSPVQTAKKARRALVLAEEIEEKRDDKEKEDDKESDKQNHNKD